MTNAIDENNLLIFDPSTASIIFTVGEGILTKSKKIVASLTQALILFSDKVVNQEISFIRFQNHRMVFIHEHGLYGVKIVPKDQLTKNFLPSIKIMLNIQNQMKKLDSTVSSQAEEKLNIFYRLLKNPELNLYVFPESIEGYLSLLIVMATLNYDLSINLESIKNNFVILKMDSVSKLPQYVNETHKGIISFGLNLQESLSNANIPDVLEIDNKTSLFNTIFPNNKSNYKLISLIIGTESSSHIISQIIDREQSINEVALSLVKLPETTMAVEIATEAISNFSKEQRLAKPLYRIIIKRLKDLEGQIDLNLQSEKVSKDSLIPNEVKTSSFFTDTKSTTNDNKTQEIQKLDFTSISSTSEIIPQSNSTPDSIAPAVTPSEASSFTSSDLTALANEFTSKLEDLTKSEPDESKINKKLIIDPNKEILDSKSLDTDISSMKLDKNHIFMEHFKIYFDFSSFRLGINPEQITFRPSIQIVRINNDMTRFIVRISPLKHQWFQEICENLKKQINIEFRGENGDFDISTSNEHMFDVFRVSIWSSIIIITYAIQKGEIDLPEIFNITNDSNLCLILDLTPERKKQLPSQIEEIIEEEKQLHGTGVEDLVKSIDSTILAISNAMKKHKGVGFVLRKNTKELPLILEFILTLSEMCGIGWSRW
jgi:hypothetical protein